MFDQVNFDKDPALANLGTGYFTRTRLFLQRDGMNFEQFGGLLKGERIHGAISRSKPSRTNRRLTSKRNQWYLLLRIGAAIQRYSHPCQV